MLFIDTGIVYTHAVRLSIYDHFVYFQVFEQTDFNKKHKAISIKPINFSCILKLSKVQLQERSFKVTYYIALPSICNLRCFIISNILYSVTLYHKFRTAIYDI